MASLPSAVRAIPLPLRLLLVAAALEVLAWTVATAPFQGPDESAHYAYVQYTAETGHRPSPDGGGGIVARETDGLFTGFNLYTLKRQPEARPFWTTSEVEQWRQFEATLTSADRGNGSGPNSVAKNPPLYYALQAVPYKLSVALGAEPFARLFWMRIANGLLFLALVWLTWLIAAELFASTLLRTVATACTALLPMAAFMGAAVNPDSLLAATWAGALLVALRLIQRGFSRGRIAALLALTGVSLLTHGRGLPLLALTGCALLLAWNRHRPPVSRRALAAGAVAVVAVALVGVVALGGRAYGGELSFRSHFSPFQFASFVWQFYFPKLPFTAPRPGPNFGYLQFFIEGYLPGAFGGQEVRWSTDVYRLMQLVVFASFLGLVVACASLWRPLRARWDVALLLLVFVAVPLLFLHLASYRAAVQSGATDALIVGRYLLPLTPALGLAVAVIVRSLRAGWRPVAAGLAVAIGLLLQLGALGLTVERFYG